MVLVWCAWEVLMGCGGGADDVRELPVSVR